MSCLFFPSVDLIIDRDLLSGSLQPLPNLNLKALWSWTQI